MNIKDNSNCSKSHSRSPPSPDHRNRYQHHDYHNTSHHSNHHNHHSHRSNLPPPQPFNNRENINNNKYRGFINNHNSYHQPSSSRRSLEFDRNMHNELLYRNMWIGNDGRNEGNRGRDNWGNIYSLENTPPSIWK